MAAQGARVASGSARRHKRPLWLRDLQHDLPIHLVLLVGLGVAFIPIAFMLMISLKSMGQFITQPLGLSLPLEWKNYVIAFIVVKRSLVNSVGMTAAVIALSLAISSLAGYVFARFEFPGRELAFWLYLSVLFVPPILTFATRYVLVAEMGLLDTYAVQVLPYVAHAQVFQTVILRSFFASLPQEVMEAAKVDGANVIQVFLRIVLPMSRPILATLAVLRAIGFWDEWLWPMVTVRSGELRPLALQVFYLSSHAGAHVGWQMAANVIASLPLVILFALASKQFVEGLTSGAVKF